MKKNIIKYCIVFLSFLFVFGFTFFSHNILKLIENNKEHGLLIVFFLISILFLLSTLISHISRLAKLPSFVIAIVLGILAKPFLTPITSNQESLSVIVGLGATLILFSGGIETPFESFKKIIGKILSLSFIGLLITAFLTSIIIYYISGFLGFQISIISSVLLGAVLASTDPAAIIPVLKKLKFQNRSIKDIVVSESAVTDVTGTLVTIVFLSLIVSGVSFNSITSWYGSIFESESLLILLKQILFGFILGFIGYILLKSLLKLRKNKDYEHEADLPFFLFIPIIIFVFALILEGSGYLAAFIAGLLFHLSEHLRKTEQFFNSLVEGFFKPTIFILLGALVEIGNLFDYALIGIIISVLFMFAVRPIAVFISLIPFKLFGKEKITTKEMLFISFVRETGAIPAVLLVTIMSMNIPNTNGLIEIGMWIILSTLIILPPLTPIIAKKLGVATEIKENNFKQNACVVLVSRGKGFLNRLDFISEWIENKKMHKIIVFLCLEEKYKEELEIAIKNLALEKFQNINSKLKSLGKHELDFEIISKKGKLEQNIHLIKNKIKQPIAIIFAGKKMLDYYPNEIKNLSIPIQFID